MGNPWDEETQRLALSDAQDTAKRQKDEVTQESQHLKSRAEEMFCKGAPPHRHPQGSHVRLMTHDQLLEMPPGI